MKMKRRRFVQASGLVLSHGCLSTCFPVYATDAAGYTAALIGDEVFLEHHISRDHPESPGRITAFNRLLSQSPPIDNLLHEKPGGLFENWLTSVHTPQHIESLRTHFPVAHRVAASAVSAALHAIDLVAGNIASRVFCATRPPGHHALNSGKEEGFCYYNHIAIAARYAQRKHGLKKILIIDWDYHHGNSTEAIFYPDPSVLFFSTHDQFAYPGTGAPEKRGEGKGHGFNVNIHLPCSTGDDEILSVYHEKLVPLAEQFRPELVLVSAGFDSRRDDLLGCFDITDQGFRKLTELAIQIADKYSQGRLVSVLEGGYNLQGNAMAMYAHLDTLAGTPVRMPG